MDIFEALLARIPRDTGADQTIALRTSGGQIYVMENRNILSGDHSDEDTFLQSLAQQEITEVTHLVCQWSDGCVDVPSMHFRQGLLALSEGNSDTCILLQGEHGYIVKPVRVTMPAFL